MRLSRTTTVGLGLATLGSLLAASPAAATSSATSSGTSPAHRTSATRGASALPAGLVRVATRKSLLGTHTWYRQTFRGLPVLGGYYAQHAYGSGRVGITDGRRAVPASLGVRPKVTSGAATDAAVAAQRSASTRQAAPSKRRTSVAEPGRQRASLAVLGGKRARLVWRVIDAGAAGSTETVVDASTGSVLSRRSLAKNADGTGRVFDPNPSTTLRSDSLLDKKDADQSIFDPAYGVAKLTHLDGSGLLHGDWARSVNKDAATSASHEYLYKRHDNRFEQVMAYYHVTSAQGYIQSLGFLDVNNEPQKLSTDTIRDDNSFYDPSTDQITFGDGGVDDAEDAEVVWHEYGHAIQDAQVPGFGSSEQGGAIGEGFGDYWAVTMSIPTGGGYGVPCVAEWDSVSYTSAPHCLRRVDGTKTVADLDGEVHDDGEIWSRALYDIHLGLGRKKADTVILESQFQYAPDTSFAAAAAQVVSVARALYGNGAALKCRAAFTKRGILG
jgi:Zn-dependent metalloprotease